MTDETNKPTDTNVSSHQCPECGAYTVFEAHGDDCSMKPKDLQADPVAVVKEDKKAKKNEYMRVYMRAYRAKKKEEKGDGAVEVQAG
jgi:hypothetical protein